MPARPTDFYLNLDRWEALSAVERDRGRWEARKDLPPVRLDAIRGEAIVQACRALLDPPDQNRPDIEKIVFAEKSLDDSDETIREIRSYGRSIQMIHGWYPALAWTEPGMQQLIQGLPEGRLRPTPEALNQLLFHRLQAALVGRQTGTPILELASFYGWLIDESRTNPTHKYFYCLMLRLVLLQQGYTQVQYAALEPAFVQSTLIPTQPSKSEEATDEQLGLWLDDLTNLLAEVGRQGEAAWKKLQAGGARTALQESILSLAQRRGKVSAGDVIRATGANRNTVKDNLTRLVEEGVLRKRGQKRGTLYYPPS